MKTTWMLIFALTFVRKDNSQRVVYPEETELCAEEIGGNAVCVGFTDCPTAKDDVRQGKIPTSCGFAGDIPLVCCLINTVPNDPKTTPGFLCGRTARTKGTDDLVYQNDSYVQVNASERLTINTDGSFIIQPRILRREKFRASEDWPWMIAIYLKSNGSFVCNGFFIDSSSLLTAAHCFQGKRTQPQDYYIGTIHNEEKTSAEIIELRIHENYKDYYYNDIALLKISPLAGVTSICLPSTVDESNYRLETEAIVLDWVGTEYVTHRTQIAEAQLCDQLYTNLSNSPFPDGITKELMCAIPTERSENICQVHSGGPVMIQVDGKWMAVGIATFGIPCTLPTYPAVYTAISPYLLWIRSK